MTGDEKIKKKKGRKVGSKRSCINGWVKTSKFVKKCSICLHIVFREGIG